MNTTLNKIENLVSSQKEFDMLLECDSIYLILANDTDDNDLIKEFDVRNFFKDYDTCKMYTKLRGPKNGPYRINNRDNVHDFCHGYVIGLDNSDRAYFENKLSLFSIKTGYGHEKIDVKKYRRELKVAINKFFGSLFEEK